MRKFLLLIVCVIVSLALGAKNISEDEAQRIALNFVNGSVGNKAFKAKKFGPQQVCSAKLQSENLYGFNITEGGYVLVSANSNAYQILGYADSGSLDNENMPENMKAWINGYDEAIKALQAIELEPSDAPVISGGAIEPLISTTWYQDAPYSNLCPKVPNGKGSEVTAPTGCVATAMAQVMYYHKWPSAECTAIPGYDFSPIKDKTITLSELPSKKFNWDDMLLAYANVDATEQQKLAVAELMQYCGQAVKMVYGANASGAQETAISTAARTYFGYDKGTKTLFRSYYSINQWENMIYEELKAGRPVPYAGINGTDGHSFVCDGYDGNGLFHINWGWEGRSDGYFRLSVLNPYNNTSVGSSSNQMGFSYMQQAVFGMQPPVTGSEEFNQEIYFNLVEPVKINNLYHSVSIYVSYESLSQPKNKIIVALGTKEGDMFTPFLKSNEIEVDQDGDVLTNIEFMIDPNSVSEGETIFYFRAKPAEGDFDWFTLGSDDNCIRVVKEAGEISLSMLPEKKIEITEVYTEDNQTPKVDENKKFSIKIKNNDTKELNTYVDVIFYEMGDISLENQHFNDLRTSSSYTSGLYIRPGETESIQITKSFSTPGNAAFLICEHGTSIVLAKGSIYVSGDEIDFYDFQVKEYSLELDDVGTLSANITIINNDERRWKFPENSNYYIRGYINGSEDIKKNTIQSGETIKILFLLDAWDYEIDESVHFVIEEVLGGIRTKKILEQDIKFNEVITSGVKTVNTDKVEDPIWYSIQGIRISKPSIPGLYIHNGKKTVIR
ncbi:MAG: C10 family peptidase [Prevotella sp.]|nr:C10 family peptidase [Prevotella sp.]